MCKVLLLFGPVVVFAHCTLHFALVRRLPPDLPDIVFPVDVGEEAFGVDFYGGWGTWGKG